LIGFPVWFSETPAKIASRAPQFGEHTEEVLLDIGGYSWEDIATFREEEVI
jgi:crotonobetainyl-CoA:carnitine CoA-transferase CaiB-like acyl-CoA transferase